MLSSEDFFVQIKRKILKSIQTKEFDIEKIKKLISGYNFELLESFTTFTIEYNRSQKVQRLDIYKDLFTVIITRLTELSKENKIGNNYILNEESISLLINDILDLLLLKKVCSECNSEEVYKTSNPFNETQTSHFCRNCQKRVKILHKIEYVPILLAYINEWANMDANSKNKAETILLKKNHRKFLFKIFQECFEFLTQKGSIQSLLLVFKILEKNNIQHKLVKNELLFKELLIDKLKFTLRNHNFRDFISGKIFFNQNYGELDNEIQKIFIRTIVNSLKTGEFLKISNALEQLLAAHRVNVVFNNLKNKYKDEIETNYYLGLAASLEKSRFKDFKKMFEFSDKFDIHIKVSKIPNRFKIVSKLIKGCLQEISVGYQTSSLGKIIEILRFCNQFNLLNKKLSSENQKTVKKLKKDRLLIANLKDLFGHVSNAFLLYIHKVMPSELYDFFVNEPNAYSFYTNAEQMVSYILMFFDRYSVYGLSVENLGLVQQFLKNFKKTYSLERDKILEESPNYSNQENLKFIEFYFKNRKHLASPENLQKNNKKILSKEDYNFYSLSMVLLGGLGPQGHGFSYSTPKGEVVEVCSDIKENEAIIVKYKKFLKKQFISKLEEELANLKVNRKDINKVIKYLMEIIDQKEAITYQKKNTIIRQIKSYLTEFDEVQNREFQNLLEKISDAISVILRKIKLDDQFKTRMELVSQEKLKSEDIAKLTSLKNKSHYDVLRERFFYQYIVKWFYEIYTNRKFSDR
ncbi:MAG: hypothetical protein GF383_05150 [Candidatus Lokiarchaeota archaeon]|nr:hypothetical protein [Candidatus Lokiarchaeota archaeon]MBD3339279.1 hypothetical protein [Candidatus Lokiarchaeota archaeon]